MGSFDMEAPNEALLMGGPRGSLRRRATGCRGRTGCVRTVHGSKIAVPYSMRLRYLGICFSILSCEIAQAAALVPVPRPSSIWLTGGLEENRGQAKAEVLFLSRGDPAIAVTAQSVLFSPLGARMSFVAGNPNPAVRFLDTLPGVVNSFTGADPRKWVTGIPRYASAVLTGVYSGIDLRYAIGTDNRLTLWLLLMPAVDPKLVVLDVPKAVDTLLNFDAWQRAAIPVHVPRIV